MLKNKIIIIITSFYIVYLGVLPVFISKTAEVICNNLSQNSAYEITLKNPKIRFSLLPTVRFGAEEISVKEKKVLLKLILKTSI